MRYHPSTDYQHKMLFNAKVFLCLYNRCWDDTFSVKKALRSAERVLANPHTVTRFEHSR